jgi:hypothetical protein
MKVMKLGMQLTRSSSWKPTEAKRCADDAFIPSTAAQSGPTQSPYRAQMSADGNSPIQSDCLLLRLPSELLTNILRELLFYQLPLRFKYTCLENDTSEVSPKPSFCLHLDILRTCWQLRILGEPIFETNTPSIQIFRGGVAQCLGRSLNCFLQPSSIRDSRNEMFKKTSRFEIRVECQEWYGRRITNKAAPLLLQTAADMVAFLMRKPRKLSRLELRIVFADYENSKLGRSHIEHITDYFVPLTGHARLLSIHLDGHGLEDHWNISRAQATWKKIPNLYVCWKNWPIFETTYPPRNLTMVCCAIAHCEPKMLCARIHMAEIAMKEALLRHWTKTELAIGAIIRSRELRQTKTRKCRHEQLEDEQLEDEHDELKHDLQDLQNRGDRFSELTEQLKMPLVSQANIEEGLGECVWLIHSINGDLEKWTRVVADEMSTGTEGTD